MLALARWLMRGTPYAAGGAALAALVPWLFWLGAAIAALVTLRKGFAPALPVIIAAALPAGFFHQQELLVAPPFVTPAERYAGR